MNEETNTPPAPQNATQSDAIGKLAEALSKAQKDIESAHKAAENPFFKSSYADLTSCWDACREPLAKNDLAVMQTTQGEELKTVLAHKSGEWISGTTSLIMGKQDMQGLGSAITYARRYGLCAIVGISPADDDGNAAVGKKTKPKAPPWNGPLPKTKFIEALRTFGADIRACEDYDSPIALLNVQQSIDLQTQCEKDMPGWWLGETEPEVTVGLKDKIEEAKKKLADLDKPPMDA